jgi:hypothetical protein
LFLHKHFTQFFLRGLIVFLFWKFYIDVSNF